MCRNFISFFVCLFALAACSPRLYHGEQVARASTNVEDVDSSHLQQLVDKVVQEEVQKQLSLQEWTEQTQVREVLSSPDSSGKQHVTERTTTTTSKHSQASAQTSHVKNEQVKEQKDSTSFTQETSSSFIEKIEVTDAKVKGSLPWYWYVVLVAIIGAAIVGFYLGVRKKKWFIL